MAYSGTVTWGHHGTLGGGTVDTVNFTQARHRVLVTNRGGTALYLRPSFAGTAVPSADADDTIIVLANANRQLFHEAGITALQVISAGASIYDVEVY